jgi:phosphoribosylformylglycinamidine cyclo-ligase
MSGIDYRQSGVDIDEGTRAVELMKKEVKKTFNSNVLSDLGHFGGLFRADFPGLKEPVLVASTDGVGTKLKVASMACDYSTVGCDLVNHCVNDILVQGAIPLFFMDYLACGKLDATVAAGIVTGMAKACLENGCALLGGETAEMPGFYNAGDYDVAGTIVGVVDRSRIIDGSAIVPGHAIIGLPSSGLHTNGYSLARAVLFGKEGLSVSSRHEILEEETLGQVLLKVHRSYLKQIMPLLEPGLVTGMAHITGGGIPGNLVRILPAGCGAVITPGWQVPPVFKMIQSMGSISDKEMRRAFNMGAGFLLTTAHPERVMEMLRQAGEDAFQAGRVISGDSIEYSGEGVLS